MEILSIITERPDRVAAPDVGRLPAKHLEHRRQQGDGRAAPNGSSRATKREKKRRKKKEEKRRDPLVDYE